MKLVQFAGLWTLVNHPARQREWSIVQKLRAVKAAGFAGICARLDASIAYVAAKQGLFTIGLVFPDDPAEFASLLSAQKSFGAEHVDVQLAAHDTTPAHAVKKWIRLEKEAEKLGLIVSLETHRDTITETPEKLFELADRYFDQMGRPLRLTWDFSHLAVVKHLHTGNFVARLLARPDLVQHATQFHFRPFNGHHAQLPVTHRGKLTPEICDYLDFAQEVMHIWKIAPRNRERTMLACPELGPPGGYALSGFPPVWPDAIVLSQELTKCWQRAR